jgi:prepilin-type N-terminal cleavage/methylation domain-containing protein
MNRRSVVLRNRRPRDRAGFTLVELMVGMMVMTVGVLGLAGTSAVVMRQMNESGSMNVASSVGQARIEKLRLASCTVATSGSATTRGIAESWTLTPGTRSAQIQEIVTFPTRRGTRSQTYLSLVPCT